MKSSAQRGVINPLVIGGVVVLGIIVFLVASGTFRFSGYIKTDSNKPQENQSAQAPQQTPKPTEAPKPQAQLNPEPLTDSKLGFSFSYPEGWKTKSESISASAFKPSETQGSDKADALVSVVTGDLGELKDSKLPTIGDLHKVYIKKQFSGVEFIVEKDVKVNGQDGFELEFTGSMNSENMHARYIVIKGEKSLYAVIGMSKVGMWNDLKETIDASIQTLKIQ